MALPEITGDAKLITDPRHGIAKTGSPWANCMIRFTGYRKDGDDWVEDSSFTAALAAFGDEAAQLAAFAKGDGIHVEGRLRSLRIWTPAKGESRPDLEITVRSVSRPERRPRNPDQPPRRGAQNARTPDLRGAGAHAAPASRQAQVDNVWPRPGIPDLNRRDDRAGLASASRLRETGGATANRPHRAGQPPTQHAGRRRDAAPARPSGTGGIVTNLRDHVAARRNRTPEGAHS